MQINTKIDAIIQSLETLKNSSLAISATTINEFEELLTSEINTSSHARLDMLQNDNEPSVPAWVDKNIPYDPANPRRPNMKEMMQALSGKSLDTLYENGTADEYSRLASELLNGTVNQNKDTRDWVSIMQSSDITSAVREANKRLYDPRIDIVTIRNVTGDVIDQYPAVLDKDNNVLRSLGGGYEHIEHTLQNFGVPAQNIPDDLSQKLSLRNIDSTAINHLEKFKAIYSVSQV